MQSAARCPERPAVLVEGRTVPYNELQGLATRIAATIQAHPEFSRVPLTAVFGYRSPAAFAGVLGALLAGNGYVPLNRTFPIERTVVMFERSECRSIVVDTGSLPQLGRLLDLAGQPLLVLLPDAPDAGEYRGQWPRHTFIGLGGLSSAGSWREPAATPDAIAYLLFTSGSTGIPKGVMVAQRNVTSYLDYMVDRYEILQKHLCGDAELHGIDQRMPGPWIRGGRFSPSDLECRPTPRGRDGLRHGTSAARGTGWIATTRIGLKAQLEAPARTPISFQPEFSAVFTKTCNAEKRYPWCGLCVRR